MEEIIIQPYGWDTYFQGIIDMLSQEYNTIFKLLVYIKPISNDENHDCVINCMIYGNVGSESIILRMDVRFKFNNIKTVLNKEKSNILASFHKQYQSIIVQ